jgi:hypothetical protein
MVPTFFVKKMATLLVDALVGGVRSQVVLGSTVNGQPVTGESVRWLL